MKNSIILSILILILSAQSVYSQAILKTVLEEYNRYANTPKRTSSNNAYQVRAQNSKVMASQTPETSDLIYLIVTGKGTSEEDATNIAFHSATTTAEEIFTANVPEVRLSDLSKASFEKSSPIIFKKMQKIACLNMPDGGVEVFLKVFFGSSASTNSNASGSSSGFSGQSFATKMKLKNFNKKREATILKHLSKYVRASILSCYDPVLNIKDPVLPKDEDDSGNYLMELVLEYKRNANYNDYKQQILKILDSISLSSLEVKDYENHNMMVSSMVFSTYPTGKSKFYFRSSQNLLTDLIRETIDDINSTYMNFSIVDNTGQVSYFDLANWDEELDGIGLFKNYKEITNVDQPEVDDESEYVNSFEFKNKNPKVKVVWLIPQNEIEKYTTINLKKVEVFKEE